MPDADPHAFVKLVKDALRGAGIVTPYPFDAKGNYTNGQYVGGELHYIAQVLDDALAAAGYHIPGPDDVDALAERLSAALAEAGNEHPDSDARIAAREAIQGRTDA